MCCCTHWLALLVLYLLSEKPPLIMYEASKQLQIEFNESCLCEDVGSSCVNATQQLRSRVLWTNILWRFSSMCFLHLPFLKSVISLANWKCQTWNYRINSTMNCPMNSDDSEVCATLHGARAKRITVKHFLGSIDRLCLDSLNARSMHACNILHNNVIYCTCRWPVQLSMKEW